jgi:hypothetical protein
LGYLPWTNTFPIESLKAAAPTDKLGLCNYLSFFGPFKDDISDPKIPGKLVDTSFRPMSIVPGEYAILNSRMSGITLSEFNIDIRANNAQILLDDLDSTVSIYGDEYRLDIFNNTSHYFNDNGLITHESNFTPMQGETFGGRSTYTEGTFKESKDSEGNAVVEPAVECQTPRSRVRSFLGYLGNMFNLFFSRPEKSELEGKKFLSQNDNPKDEGLLHLNVDTDGRVAIRTPGGFSIERYDRIPVPFRRARYDDPAGDSDEVVQQPIKPFVWNTTYNHARSLELSDYMAYEYKNSYQRAAEYSKDFYIPEESDDISPTNKAKLYEGLQNQEDLTEAHDLESNTGKRAGLFIGDDGSVIIRDGWGSEIVMEGGSISMSAVCDINILPGRSLIMLAGDDVVAKAYNSIDIFATKHDVRIKGDRNVHICGGSDSSDGDGGVLIESLATSPMAISKGESGKNLGEQSVTSGIFFKAPESIISLDSMYIAQHSTEMIDIWGPKTIFISGETYIEKSSGVSAILDDSAALIVSQSSAIMCASDGAIVAGGSAMIFNGGDIPVWWDGSGDSPASSIISELSEVAESLENSHIFNEEILEDIQFSCRTSYDCGTITGIEAEKKSPYYIINEPYWSILNKLGYTFIEDIKSQDWDEHTIRGEYPWPGKDAYDDTAKYLTLSKPSNTTTDTKNGSYYSKDRAEISNTGGELKLESFKSYKIQKT